MEIQITGKNTEISEDLRLFAERKIKKLEKFLSRDMSATTTLSEQASKKGSKSHRAEVVMHIKGKVISAREDAPNYFIAIDAVVEKLRRQLKKEKNKWLEKTRDKRTKPAKVTEPASATIESRPADDQLDLEVRKFTLKPLTVEEAIAAMQDSKQPFFLFVNDQQTINCVYSTEQGGFGIMVPETPTAG